MPKISVLMSAYNCATYIEESLKSICEQTFTDFEFLIIDDASTDDTWGRLQAFSANDRRIRLFRNERNSGVANSVNRLIAESSGQYIARMDADDIALSHRFEKQVEILDSGKADLCGSWMTVFGAGREFLWRTRVEDEEIRCELLFTSAFCNPTVMLRRELMERHPYDPETVPAADYDLWVRIAPDATLYNIPEPLVRYRKHRGQISQRKNLRQGAVAAKIAVNQLRNLGVDFTEEEGGVHASIVHSVPPVSLNEVKASEAWLCKLIGHFDGKPVAQKIIALRWFRYCLKAAELGLGVFWIFSHSSLKQYACFRPWRYSTILLLSLFRIRRNSRFYRLLVPWSPVAKVKT